VRTGFVRAAEIVEAVLIHSVNRSYRIAIGLYFFAGCGTGNEFGMNGYPRRHPNVRSFHKRCNVCKADSLTSDGSCEVFELPGRSETIASCLAAAGEPDRGAGRIPTQA